MTELQVKTRIYSQGYSREPDPSDKWDRGDMYQEYGGIEVYYSKDNACLGYITNTLEADFDVKPGDVVFVVVVQYSTGDTFGRSDGQIHIYKIFNKYDEAADVQSKILNGEISDYVWTGYFEHLEDVYVETEVVRA